jgi:radical SAM superfamily enzyme YgiQ (UPF0313 family)
MYLAAVLEQEEIPVVIRNYSTFTSAEAIADLPESDIYGITVTSLELLEANRFAKAINERFPRAKVILSAIDAICKGDGEKTLLKMIDDYASGKLEQVYIGEFVHDLDAIPLPARKMLAGQLGGNIFAYNKNYFDTGGSTVVLSSRGCPCNCSFCSSPSFKYNNGMRLRSPKLIGAEIRQVIEDFGIRQFRFSDDMFTADRKRVLQICDEIGGLDIVWRISCRVKPLDGELLGAMRQAGCREISLGVESFDDNVLKTLRKGTTADDNRRALETCAEHDIKTRVLFMIRTPGQSEHTVAINIAALEKAPYDIICCTTFVPIPGSEIWTDPDAYGIEILDRNLDDYNFYFFGPDGEHDLKNIIKIKERSLEQFNAETLYFRDYLKQTGKLNLG